MNHHFSVYVAALVLPLALFTTGCEQDESEVLLTNENATTETSSSDNVEDDSERASVPQTQVTREGNRAEVDESEKRERAGEEEKTEAAPLPTNWCEALGAGVGGTREELLDFARAQTAVGLFGVTANRIALEESLAIILENDDLLSGDNLDSLLGTWSQQDPQICIKASKTANNTPPTVEVNNNVAMITPGVGSPELPAAAEAVIINLTELKPGDDVSAAVSAAIGEQVQTTTKKVRKFMGLPSFGEDWTHYESTLESINESIAPTGTSTLPIAFWIGPGLTPEAARIAGGMRLNGQARIIGEMNLFSLIAESCWSPIGDSGVAWRCATLTNEGKSWPDVIPADGPFLDDWSEMFISALEPVTGNSSRPYAQPYNRGETTTTNALTRGTMRAAILAGYGMFDWFYPYFDLVGRDLDSALLTAIDEINELNDGDRSGFMKTLGRFMHDLYDGHGFYSDWASTDWPDGYLAAQIKQIDGLPVVRVSAHAGLFAGDTITAIDGVDSEVWYEEAMSRYSAASTGYRFVLATDEMTSMKGSLELTLKGVDGTERTEVFQPEDYLTKEQVPWGGSLRENGWLSDLGKSDIYYLNMAGPVTPDVSFFFEEFDAISKNAAGMVLDMRDYPNLDIYELARYFNTQPFTAPHFGFPTWTGADDYELTFEIWEFMPAPNPYQGPVALIVSNHSVSAAECISQMLMDLDNVTVVGQQSASTNGTITSFRVPGNIELTFTGMRLLNLDGSDFHGIGVIPDVEVTPTAEEFANGIDPELEAAIQVLESNLMP